MIKKFHAATTRDALRQVRDALGANAIILSNRQADGGVEIIAVADLDVSALAEKAEPVSPRNGAKPAATQTTPRPEVRPAPPQSEYVREATSLYQQVQAESNAYAETHPHAEIEPEPDAGGPQALTPFAEYIAQREASVIRSQRKPAASPHPAQRLSSHPDEGHVARRQPAYADTPHAGKSASISTGSGMQPASPPPAGNGEMQPVMHELAREVRMLRSLVEGQLAGLAWGDVSRREPQRAEVMKRLLAAGFSPALTRQLLEKLPPESNLERAMKWVRTALAHNLQVGDPVGDLIDEGGIYALVGPTGVGKTTTVAKLAARAVLKHGASKVAMVTTDSYRIGAQDQLRIYGRILGTPVFAVRDESDLELTLLDLKNKHLVLVDTIGMSQRDRRVSEQISMLCGDGQSVRRILLLGAPGQGVTLEEVVRAYSGPGLAGCILTKIDEALTYGPALDVVIRHQLKLQFVTNGQRVPEDLHMANAMYLIDRAFRLGNPDPAFTTDEGDYPVLMAAAEAIATAADTAFDPSGALGAAV